MQIKVLGSGQDAGTPHTGCYCNICDKARQYTKYKRLGPSISISNKDFCYLIDVSPDFKYQLDMIKGSNKISIDGILLTHAHFGHCSGLLHLGKEAMNMENVMVFCTPKMKQFLSNNYPFKLLVKEKNIIVKEIKPGKEMELNQIKYIPIEVPHRNEIADTVGYIIRSEREVIYLPDIDYWTNKIINRIRNVDIALIDGTFYSKNEISRFKGVSHPPIRETIELLENINTEVYFTHINHTNPVNNNDKERKYVEDKGFSTAYDEMTIKI